MKKALGLAVISLLAGSAAHADYSCWEGSKVGSFRASVETKDSSYAISALASCDDEDNCDAPVINYQLGGGDAKIDKSNGKIVVTDAKDGAEAFSLELNPGKAASNVRGDKSTCAARKCFEGRLSGETSIKPGKEMEARLKDGVAVTCIESKGE